MKTNLFILLRFRLNKNAHKRIPVQGDTFMGVISKNLYKSTYLPKLFSECKHVKNKQRIKGFKKADSSCQYILGISHEIYQNSTGAQNLAENRAVFSGF